MHYSVWRCDPASLFAIPYFFGAILHLQTLPYQNRVVAIFSRACMADNSKWPIYTGIEKSS